MTDLTREPAVALAMVNWNGWHDLEPCFESLRRLRNVEWDVVVCDNASQDDSVERLAQWVRTTGWTCEVVDHGPTDTLRNKSKLAPPKVLIVRNRDNAGFARGTNISMRYALAARKEYLALWALNVDTIVDPAAAEAALAELLADPGAGSVQSLLLRYPDDTTVDSAGLRLLRRGGAQDLLRGRSPRTLSVPDTRRISVFGCCAASAFYRVSALREVGLFDESLYQTNEDVDLACRLRAAGHGALLAPYSVVRHKGGISRHKKRGRMWFTTQRAKLRVVGRWWPRPLAVLALAVGVLRVGFAMLRRQDISISDWAALIGELWRDLTGSPAEAVRRTVLREGVRGFL